MTQNIEWTRFWYPSDKEPYFNPQGYLIDPEIEFSSNSYLIKDLLNLKENCIILLGEPGIGKTIAMEKYKKDLGQILNNTENKILYVNLRSVGNEIHFKNSLFDNTIFQEWINGNYKLYLLLDSFDECFLRAGVISGLLVDSLKNYHTERLYLRIVCRTGFWPISLQDELLKIFGNGNVLNYILAPLRKRDIESAAEYEIQRSELISPSDFIRKIEDVELVPFATKPITLKALIKQYKRSGILSASKEELYKSYCLYLCEETNQMRRDENLAIEYTPQQKYIVAARCAALCIFSGKIGIWIAPEIEGIAEEYIHQSILRQGQEIASDQGFDISDDCITETLAGGLFNSLSPRCNWAHWSFLEFLAADYINQKEIPLAQLLSLIKNPIDRKIIPQLRGVVAWLCSFNIDLYQNIIEQEPEILLQSDLTLFSDNEKETIFSAILNNYENSSIQIRFFNLASQFKRLNHFNLANQIQEYIINPNNSKNAKRFAIRVAEECKLNTLAPSFIGLILNEEEHIKTRITAGHALETFSYTYEIDGIEELIPIALLDEPSNDDYDLKGLCLNILWPQFIGLNELLDHLPEPIHGYGGSYFRFLIQNFIERLTDTELENLLRWFRENSSRFSEFSIFHKILEQTLVKSLSFINNNEIFTALAQTLCTLVINGYYSRRESSTKQPFQTKLIQNQGVRRELLKKVIQGLPNEVNLLIQLIDFSQIQGYISVIQRPRLFELMEQNDLEWLVEEFKISNDDNYNQKLAFYIFRILPRNSEGYNLACTLYHNYPIFRQYFLSWFGPIELESDIARRMREEYEREQSLEQRLSQLEQERNPPQLEPPPHERINDCLENIEQGNMDYWWRLNMEMTLTSNSRNYGNELNPNLIALPGWNQSSIDIQGRIITAAKRYILEGEPNDESWLGTNNIYRPAYAGYRALRLIYENDPEFIESLTIEIWQKWISIILLFKFSIFDSNNLDHEEEIRSELLRISYPYANEQLINALSREIDYEDENISNISVLNNVEKIYDISIGNALQNIVQEMNLAPNSYGEILEFLLSHDFQPIRVQLNLILTDPLLRAGQEREFTIRAGRAVMIYSPEDFWDTIYALIQNDVEWGRELIKQVANSEKFSKQTFEKYNEDQLSNLYIWVHNQYPYEADRDLTGGVRFLNQNDFISSWRDEILNYLESKGTYESVSAIQKIIRNIPQIREQLNYRLLRAQEFARMKTWEPPKPQEIYELFQNSTSRLIQSGENLLDILIESIQRLEDKLQGRHDYTPGAISLWDYREHRLFRPKYEEDFSDYVKNHLQDDLNNIIIHREVQIDQRNRPDLFVNIVNVNALHRENRIISAVIEVKGSWHQEISTAMSFQLYEQYMIPRALPYGLYLVGWFRSQYWDPDDTRSSRNIDTFNTITELSEYLEDQAHQLSEEGFLIKSKVIDASLNEIHLNRYRE